MADAHPNTRSPRVTFWVREFSGWLVRNGIPWPRLDSGSLALDDETFREMARAYPAVAPLRELRHALGELRLFSDLAVGSDGRNRCLLSVFRSTTGRNQPSNARFIFGPSCWLRSLIRPEPGRGIAYVDWTQQEFGIAAALSGDPAMLEAYTSGDPYLTFAKQARAVPADATKRSHPNERELFRVCAPIHDALLVEGPAEAIDFVVADTEYAMAEASRVVLAGFELRSDAKVVKYLDRYADPRGARMWRTVVELPGKALHIGLAVWHAGSLAHCREDAKLTAALARRFGVSRRAGYRCPAALERAGLVSVVRHRGRCPRVTILEPYCEDPIP